MCTTRERSGDRLVGTVATAKRNGPFVRRTLERAPSPHTCMVPGPSRRPAPQVTPLIPDPFSDGVGLTSVKLAAEAVGGVAWLHADKQFTTLNFKLPAVRCPPQAAEPIEVPDLPAELGATQAPGVRAKRQPESLVNKSTDCMSSQTIVPIAAQETHTPPEISFLEPSKLLNDCATSQRRGGDEGVDKPPERPQLTAAGCPSERKLLHPVCIGIDDSLMLRKMQVRCGRHPFPLRSTRACPHSESVRCPRRWPT